MRELVRAMARWANDMKKPTCAQEGDEMDCYEWKLDNGTWLSLLVRNDSINWSHGFIGDTLHTPEAMIELLKANGVVQ